MVDDNKPTLRDIDNLREQLQWFRSEMQVIVVEVRTGFEKIDTRLTDGDHRAAALGERLNRVESDLQPRGEPSPLAELRDLRSSLHALNKDWQEHKDSMKWVRRTIGAALTSSLFALIVAVVIAMIGLKAG